MGLFTIRGRSDSAHHAPYEKPRKRKRLKKKTCHQNQAVSVSISNFKNPNFKSHLPLKQKLQTDITQVQLLEAKLIEGIIDKQEIKVILGIENYENLEQLYALVEKQKDLIFARYLEFYNRPLILHEQIGSVLDSFISNRTKSYYHVQTKHLTQELLRLI